MTMIITSLNNSNKKKAKHTKHALAGLLVGMQFDSGNVCRMRTKLTSGILPVTQLEHFPTLPQAWRQLQNAILRDRRRRAFRQLGSAMLHIARFPRGAGSSETLCSLCRRLASPTRAGADWSWPGVPLLFNYCLSWWRFWKRRRYWRRRRFSFKLFLAFCRRPTRAWRIRLTRFPNHFG